jgi:hypothetical protein
MVALVLAAQFLVSFKQMRQTGICVLVHRTKLQTPKTTAVLTDTNAPVDDWSGRVQSYAGADGDHQRQDGQPQQERHNEVETAL